MKHINLIIKILISTSFLLISKNGNLFAQDSGKFLKDTITVSLDDCIKIGMENSKTLKISKEKIYFSENKLAEVKTSELPFLRFSGSYTRLSPVDPFSIGTMTISPSILNNYSTKFTLSQPVFTGFRLSSNIEMNEFNYLASQKDYQRDKNQLIYDIKIAFYNYVKLIETQKTVQNNINVVKSRLQDLENLFKAGLATDNEVLRAKVQLSNFEIMLLETENNRDVALLALNNVLGIPVNSKINPVYSPDYPKIDVPSIESLVNEAKQNRSDLLGIMYRIKSTEKSITFAKSGWYPQISFNANYNFANPNPRIFPTQDQFKSTWDLGISLSYDLWNWRITSYQISQAEANLNQIKYNYEFMLNNVEFEVRQAYKTVLNSAERIKLTEETVKQASENYRVASEKYKNGLVLNSDVIDAELTLLLAEVGRINAIIDYLISSAKLEKAVEQNIK